MLIEQKFVSRRQPERAAALIWCALRPRSKKNKTFGRNRSSALRPKPPLFTTCGRFGDRPLRPRSRKYKTFGRKEASGVRPKPPIFVIFGRFANRPLRPRSKKNKCFVRKEASGMRPKPPLFATFYDNTHRSAVPAVALLQKFAFPGAPSPLHAHFC